MVLTFFKDKFPYSIPPWIHSHLKVVEYISLHFFLIASFPHDFFLIHLNIREDAGSSEQGKGADFGKEAINLI